MCIRISVLGVKISVLGVKISVLGVNMWNNLEMWVKSSTSCKIFHIELMDLILT